MPTLTCQPFGGGDESIDGAQDAGVRAGDIRQDKSWRLIPLLFAGYIAAYLDRVNVGFAKLQMASANRS